MIVPGPAGGRVDLEADAAAQALTCGDSTRFRCFCHSRLPSPSSLRGANATKPHRLRQSGMVRKHQTSDAQLRIGESLDSGFDAPHRPGMTSPRFAALAMTLIL